MRTFSISSGLAASTVTPGSTAPEESFTTPVIDACANETDGRRTIRPVTNSAARNVRIVNFLSFHAPKAHRSPHNRSGQILYGRDGFATGKNLSNCAIFAYLCVLRTMRCVN